MRNVLSACYPSISLSLPDYNIGKVVIQGDGYFSDLDHKARFLFQFNHHNQSLADHSHLLDIPDLKAVEIEAQNLEKIGNQMQP